MVSQLEKTKSPETLGRACFEQLIDHFTQNQWPHDCIDEVLILQTHCQGQSGRWRCYWHVDSAWERCHFYSIAPVQVPEEQRLAMAEFITLANYGMAVGNFELDFEDGEVRFKTSTILGTEPLTPDLIDHIMHINTRVLDDCLSLIFAVSYSQLSPREASRILQTPDNDADPEDAD